ncbi:MAG: hypothetical protein AB1806_00545 [Acidobacteriota bacterium]
MTSRTVWLVVLGVIAACVATTHASSPRFWKVATMADLAKGDVENLSIDPNGRLVLGPALSPIHATTEPFIWCLAVGPDGSVYAGSGNDGRVFKIDPRGRATTWFDASELEVHAMAASADGSLFVGTSPDGKVYKVDASGQSEVFFDPNEKYIWSLAFDARGRLLVGTGEKGVVYRVDAEGRGDVFYRTEAKHATSVALDRAGRVLVASDSPGRVLRVDDSGRGFVILDTPFREIRGLRVDGAGLVYAAAINGKAPDESGPAAPSPEPARAAPMPSVSTEITAVAVLDVPTLIGGQTPAAKPADTGAPKGAVYRIDPEGGWEAIWESREDLPFDLHVEEGGSILVATGNGGRVYRLAGAPASATLVTQLPVQQVTAIATAGPQRFLGTSNPGKIFLLQEGAAREGSYLSDVKDAGIVASWGTLSWQAESGSGTVQLFTRSGNTPTPGGMWSDWAGPYTSPDGEPIKSPSARYLQWKAVLRAGNASRPATAPPILTSLAIAYLQKNVRPRVTAITVHPPGLVFQKPYPTGEPEIAGIGEGPQESRFPVFSMPLGAIQPGPSVGPAYSRRLYQKGLQAFFWRAEDANDDRLEYSAFYRRADATTWYPLRDRITDAILVWDTSSVPDGSYVVKIAASDAAANSPGAGLIGELESAAFDVDNSAPRISISRVAREDGKIVVSFDVADSYSSIDRVEYSVDSGPWVPVYPVDGMADAKAERYTVALPANGGGGIVLRAGDVMNNLATARVELPSGPARAARSIR